MTTPPRLLIAVMIASFGVFSKTSRAEVTINAEVLSFNSTTTTVRFTFSGNLSELTPEVNLKNFLFIDFSESPALKSSLPATLNLTSFINNSVATESDSSIHTVEVRNNEAYYFDRISFVFDSALSAASTITAGSTLDLEFPTSSPISTSDFSELSVYWCFPAWGTNEGRGILAGVVNPTEEAPTINASRNASGKVSIEFTGVLESSPDLNSAFTPVIGATSPYLLPPGSPSKFFYRAAAN